MTPIKQPRLHCVFCGRTRKTTSDHVPPKCLFAKGARPSNMITVRACGLCNMGSSGDDEYLRLVLAMNRESGAHPAARELWPAIIRSLGLPCKAGFRQRFFACVRDVQILSKGGLILGTAKGLEIDTPRLNRIMAKIIRGLFWHEFHQRIPDSYEVLAFWVNSLRQSVAAADLAQWIDGIRRLLTGSIEKRIGRGVFVYRCQHDPNEPLRSVWGLTFFGRIHVAALTESRTEVENMAGFHTR